MFKFIKSNQSYLISLLLGLAIFGALQYQARGVFADPDGFYHAKASQLLVHGSLQNAFPWLYYTTWNTGYADQHYLYHWLLVPFNTVETLSLSIVFFGLLFILSFAWLLTKFKVPAPWVWVALMLFSSIDFLFRINLVKANTLSLALLFVVIYLAHKYSQQDAFARKKTTLAIAIVSAIFTWVYGGFICVPLVLAGQSVAWLIATKRILVSPLLASLVGIVIGVVAHPHGSNFLTLLYDQIFRTGLGAGMQVPAGNEWKAFELGWFFQSNFLILLAWLLSLIAFFSELKKSKSFNQISLWMQFLAVGLLILTLWHRRFVEYWVPLTALASAVSLAPLMAQINFDKFKQSFQFWQMKVVLLIVACIFALFGFYNVKTTAEYLRGGESYSKYQSAAEWLAQNTNPGEIVLNTQWDQFPQLFYWNSKDYYIVGLDPTFMFIHNPEKYWQWRVIADDDSSQWRSTEEVRGIVKNDLNSRYLIVDLTRNPDIIDYFEANNDSFENGGKAFSDGDIIILKVD